MTKWFWKSWTKWWFKNLEDVINSIFHFFVSHLNFFLLLLNLLFVIGKVLSQHLREWGRLICRTAVLQPIGDSGCRILRSYWSNQLSLSLAAAAHWGGALHAVSGRIAGLCLGLRGTPSTSKLLRTQLCQKRGFKQIGAFTREDINGESLFIFGYFWVVVWVYTCPNLSALFHRVKVHKIS